MVRWFRESFACTPVVRQLEFGDSFATALLLAAFSACWLHYGAFALTGGDDNGYWAQASQLVYHGTSSLRPSSPFEYLNWAWTEGFEKGVFRAKYGPGLAYFLSPIVYAVGPRVALGVPLVLGVAALIGIRRLTVLLVGPGFGFLACLLLATNETFNIHVGLHDGHLPVLVLLTWGLVGILSWVKSQNKLTLFASCFALGAIGTVRYPDVVLSLGAALFIGKSLGSRIRSRAGLLAVLGLALPLVALMVQHWWSLGAPWRTGYAATNEAGAFGLPWFGRHLGQYFRYFAGPGIGLFSALVPLGIATLIGRSETTWFGYSLLLMVLASLTLYSAYYWGPAHNPQNTLRFLLPLYPLLIAAALLGAREVMHKLGETAGVAWVVVLVTWSLVNSLDTVSWQVKVIGYQQQVLGALTELVEQNVPKGAAILSPSTLQDNLQFFDRWRLLDWHLIGPGMRSVTLKNNIPLSFDLNAGVRRMGHIVNLKPIERTQRSRAELERWSGAKAIYLVAAEEYLEGLREVLPDAICLTVASAKLPPPPLPPEPESVKFGGVLRARPKGSNPEWSAELIRRAPFGFQPQWLLRDMNVGGPMEVMRCSWQ